MSLLESLILAVVQGLTEFLPVSSSGHLLLGSLLFGTDLSGAEREAFFVVLHGASFLAVLLYFARDIRDVLRRADRLRILGALALACAPAAVVGVALKLSGSDALFEQPLLAAFGWLATAALLWSTRKGPEASWGLFGTQDGFPALRLLAIGLAQALAIVPGVSRSGATIALALLLGMRRREAFTASFLMGLPLILGAVILDANAIAAVGARLGVGRLLVGFALCFVVSLGALVLLRRMVVSRTFHRFAPYCLGLAVATMVWWTMG